MRASTRKRLMVTGLAVVVTGLVVAVMAMGRFGTVLPAQQQQRIKSQTPTGRLSTARTAQERFNPQTVIPRAFPPITQFPIMSADQIQGQVTDAELVLGVVVNQQARAYPINMLTGPQREILNDTLGGRAIAATW